ncbi:MAG: diadenylate cyclase CdaA [bacterium]
MDWIVTNWRFWPAALFEILILAFIFYYIFRFLQGTRGAQVLTGLVVAIVILFGLTYFFHLGVLHWLLSGVFVYLAIGFIVIFQPEIRHALAELGRSPGFSAPAVKRSVVDQIVQAVSFLAERRIGALIAIERETGMRPVQESGIRLDSSIEWGLLSSIFFPHAPLHDGGVIIKGGRIVAAGCLFPLTEKSEVGRMHGTRHRAAIGLTEETDAVVVVVSEESGTVSVAVRGRLSQDVEIERLRRFLSKMLIREQSGGKGTVERIKERFDVAFEAEPRTDGLERENDDVGR